MPITIVMFIFFLQITSTGPDDQRCSQLEVYIGDDVQLPYNVSNMAEPWQVDKDGIDLYTYKKKQFQKQRGESDINITLSNGHIKFLKVTESYKGKYKLCHMEDCGFYCCELVVNSNKNETQKKQEGQNTTQETPTTPSNPSNNNDNIWKILVGAVVGGAAVVFMLFIIVKKCRETRQRERQENPEEGIQLQGQPPQQLNENPDQAVQPFIQQH